MKAIVCELCGGNRLIKKDGVYECTHCGTQYTIDEARSLLTEIADVIKASKSEDLSNMLANAYTTYCDGNFAEAFKLYSNALNMDPDNPQAMLFRAFAAAHKASDPQDINIREVLNSVKRSIRKSYEDTAASRERYEFARQACTELAFVIHNILYDLESDFALLSILKSTTKLFALALWRISASTIWSLILSLKYSEARTPATSSFSRM